MPPTNREAVAAEWPTIEEQVTALLAWGWKHKTHCIWQSPTGMLFLGPHGAYKAALQFRTGLSEDMLRRGYR